jgi:hypothetical protein
MKKRVAGKTKFRYLLSLTILRVGKNENRNIFLDAQEWLENEWCKQGEHPPLEPRDDENKPFRRSNKNTKSSSENPKKIDRVFSSLYFSAMRVGEVFN